MKAIIYYFGNLTWQFFPLPWTWWDLGPVPCLFYYRVFCHIISTIIFKNFGKFLYFQKNYWVNEPSNVRVSNIYTESACGGVMYKWKNIHFKNVVGVRVTFSIYTMLIAFYHSAIITSMNPFYVCITFTQHSSFRGFILKYIFKSSLFNHPDVLKTKSFSTWSEKDSEKTLTILTSLTSSCFLFILDYCS